MDVPRREHDAREEEDDEAGREEDDDEEEGREEVEEVTRFLVSRVCRGRLRAAAAFSG
jgi:hypothetical protein